MCELFAMSSQSPATVNLSLTEFARHGGLTDGNKDGWGVSWYDGADALLVREPKAAAESASMQFVRQHAMPSRFVISHIRMATVGDIALRNTQPFSRELGGRRHVLVHNGTLNEITARCPTSGRFQPIGETDSEYALCILMDRMASIWQKPHTVPTVAARFEVFAGFARDMAELGVANFIYSDGDVMIAHGHKRHHADGSCSPGLHYLSRTNHSRTQPLEVSGLRITTEASKHNIVLLASVPLTDEPWKALPEGELVMLQGGEILQTSG